MPHVCSALEQLGRVALPAHLPVKMSTDSLSDSTHNSRHHLVGDSLAGCRHEQRCLRSCFWSGSQVRPQYLLRCLRQWDHTFLVALTQDMQCGRRGREVSDVETSHLSAPQASIDEDAEDGRIARLGLLPNRGREDLPVHDAWQGAALSREFALRQRVCLRMTG